MVLRSEQKTKISEQTKHPEPKYPEALSHPCGSQRCDPVMQKTSKDAAGPGRPHLLVPAAMSVKLEEDGLRVSWHSTRTEVSKVKLWGQIFSSSQLFKGPQGYFSLLNHWCPVKNTQPFRTHPQFSGGQRFISIYSNKKCAHLNRQLSLAY